MSWDDLISYFRTFSSLHTYHERYPEDLENPDGDIAQRFWKTLQVRTADDGQVSEYIDIEWPMALIMVKRV